MELIQDLKKRAKLVKAFKHADIFKTVGSDDERKIYPKIQEIREGKKNTKYVFILPVGIDPKLLEKNFYVFEQVFGKHIRIDGEIKTFVLTVRKPLEEGEEDTLKYNLEEIKKVIKPYRLPIICGVNAAGEYKVFDLSKEPHILIAGETGSGKSTQLRSILTTLINILPPERLQLYLADCKKSEFHIFRRVDHVQCVYSKVKDIEKMLLKIKKELDERSDLTETFEVGHVDDLPTEQRRPYIVVCIDEFIMLRDSKVAQEILIEIVAIGRTLGVFAILSMQRPNAKTLDTTIRANLTVSMGFSLRDKREATIVNTPGAEKIADPGYFVMNSDKLYDLQAPYLELEKAKELLNPFYVMKKPAKDVSTEQQELPKPTERDVFDDVDE